jgi:hypothetical protein
MLLSTETIVLPCVLFSVNSGCGSNVLRIRIFEPYAQPPLMRIRVLYIFAAVLLTRRLSPEGLELNGPNQIRQLVNVSDAHLYVKTYGREEV